MCGNKSNDRDTVGIRKSDLNFFRRMSRLWNRPMKELLSEFIENAPQEYRERFVEEGQVDADKRSLKNKEKLRDFIVGSQNKHIDP